MRPDHAIKSTPVRRARRMAFSVNINAVIVVLLLAAAILSGTTLSEAQIAVELMLMVLLTFQIIKLRFLRGEIVLLAVLLVTQIVSFIINDIYVFLLNAKIFVLAVLVFIYFKKVHYQTRLIGVVFLLNLLLVAHQVVAGEFILGAAQFIGQFQHLTASRPLGIFLHTHVSAFFAAVYLLYLAHFRRFYLLDFVYLYCIYSLFTLVSYFCQRVSAMAPIKYVLSRINVFALIAVTLVIIYLSADLILSLATATGFREFSVVIILNQLVDPFFYKPLLTPFPTDYAAYVTAQQEIVPIGNEIQYVTTYIQGGFILATVFLYHIFKHFKHFRIFIMISMLHYGLLINIPLMLYMLVTYEAELERKERMKKAQKVATDNVPPARAVPIRSLD